MKHSDHRLPVRVALVLSFLMVACSSNPHRPTEQDTTLQNAQDVGGGVTVGQNEKGEVVTSRKKKLADQLRDLQRSVYQLESDIYGHPEYGRPGLYGVLKDCYDKDGELKRLPGKAILTKKEDRIDGKMVIDENKDLVTVSEEFFLDRIKRFEDYRERYAAQKEDFAEKVRICQAKQKSSRQ